MKNIIIPVDFSQKSEFALKAGASLAKKHNAILHVVHALELSESIFFNSENEGKVQFMIAHANQQFEPFLKKEYLKNIKVIPIIKHHKVYKEVARIAEELKADLIIMGSHGVTSKKGIFAGTNTERMIHNSKTPVLIINKDPKNFDIKKVIIATDLRPESSALYLKKIALFHNLGSIIYPVYINLPFVNFISTKEFKTKVADFAVAGSSDKVACIAGHTLEDGLINYAEDINADLIAVSASSQKGLLHFFNGSISEDLSIFAKTPIITFTI